MSKLTRIAPTLLALLLCAPISNAALIDTFTDGTIVNTSAPPLQSIDQSGLSGVIGSGDRNLIWDRTAGPGTVDLDLNNLSAGNALLSSGAGTVGTWNLLYGADTPFDVDLTDAGLSNAFVISFAAADTGTLYITVEDTDTDGDTVVTPIPALPGGGLVSTLFSSFAGTVDFDHIARISIFIQGVTAGDYEMQILNTQFVPEPSTMALSTVAVIGLSCHILGRRRKAAPR